MRTSETRGHGALQPSWAEEIDLLLGPRCCGWVEYGVDKEGGALIYRVWRLTTRRGPKQRLAVLFTVGPYIFALSCDQLDAIHLPTRPPGLTPDAFTSLTRTPHEITSYTEQ
jgi:hypothetical protein